MNKTVTANIGGMVFHIEEHAYEKLNKYLDKIRSHFTMSDGRDEIIQDIESRIAEIFQQRNATKEVILEPDVEHVISVMGRPEQLFGEEETQNASGATSANDTSSKSYKRLYRDPEDRVISGVCSGLSHRLGLDPVWLRLLFVLILFLGGSGILIYIILAIVLPKAETTSQKLEMRGEQVNVNSLSKEATAPASTKNQSTISRFFDVIGSVLLILLKVVAYIAGGFIAFISLIILFSLVVTILAVLGVGGITIPVFISDYFMTTGQQFWSVIAMILVAGIPVMMLLFTLIKFLFKIKYSNRVLNISALLLWLSGLVIAAFVGFDVAREYAREEKVRTTIPLLSANADTMYVKLTEKADGDEDDNGPNITIFSSKNTDYTTGEDFFIDGDNVRFDIQKASGDKFELVQIVSARGRTGKEALEAAKQITYNFEQKDSVIMFSENMPFPKGVKYRDQSVKMLLRIPIGKQVYLDESIEEIIYDLKNVTDTWDGNMGGHYWLMTDAGLKCTDYDFANDPDANIGGNHYNDSNDQDVDIKIDQHGIRINGVSDSTKKKIESGDVKININKEGIHIKSEKNN
jgi:phage shock protein PspC (stress-responsive transcriptional regulator)